MTRYYLKQGEQYLAGEPGQLHLEKDRTNAIWSTSEDELKSNILWAMQHDRSLPTGNYTIVGVTTLKLSGNMRTILMVNDMTCAEPEGSDEL